MIWIITVQGRHVERDAQPGLAMFKKIVEPLVRILGSTESREHAHCPRTPPVHGRVDASHIGILARKTCLADLVMVSYIIWSVQSSDRNVRRVPDIFLHLWTGPRPVFHCLLFP